MPPEIHDTWPRLRPWVAGGIVFLTVLAALPILIGRWTWVVPYWYNPSPLVLFPWRLLPGLAALAVYLAGLRWLAPRSGAVMVCWALLGSVALPVTLLGLVGNPFYVLFTRTVSWQATGGFTLGAALTPAMLHVWPQLMPGWRQFVPHIAISPPGWPLLYHALSQLLAASPDASAVSAWLAGIVRPLQCHTWDWNLNQATNPQLASAWFGIASPLWAALTIMPLYAWGKALAGPQVARRAVAWWPLVPALTLFAGTLNTFYPLLATVVLYLIWQAASPERAWPAMGRALAAGVLTGLLLVLNLSLAPLLLLAGLLVLLAWRAPGDRPLRGHLLRSLAIGLAVGFGLLLVAGAYTYWLGQTPLEAIRVAMRVHMAMHRPYLPSLGLHTWDFAIYSGLAATCLALACVLAARPPAVSRLALAFGLTLLALLVSGSAQGEVGRVWLFFVPVVLLLAATTLGQLTPRQQAYVVAAQAFWLVCLAASHVPIDTWLGPPPVYAEIARPALEAPLIPADVTFGDELRLTGFQGQYRPDRRMLTVALHWRALQRMTTPYYFSVVPVAPDGQALPGTHWQPFAKLYPTTCWPAGSAGPEIVDQVDLPLGDAPAQGNWWLSLSAFAIVGDRTLPSLPVTLPDGSQDRQFGLGPLPVQAR